MSSACCWWPWACCRSWSRHSSIDRTYAAWVPPTRSLRDRCPSSWRGWWPCSEFWRSSRCCFAFEAPPAPAAPAHGHGGGDVDLRQNSRCRRWPHPGDHDEMLAQACRCIPWPRACHVVVGPGQQAPPHHVGGLRAGRRGGSSRRKPGSTSRSRSPTTRK